MVVPETDVEGRPGFEPILELFYVQLAVSHQAIVVPLLLEAEERGVSRELAVIQRVVREPHVAELEELVLVAERERGCGDPALSIDGGDAVAAALVEELAAEVELRA